MKRFRLLLSICLIAIGLTVQSARAETRPYTPKNGILNFKALLLGGGFRVSTAIKLHGNFSDFSQLEILRPESLIGNDAPPKLLQDLADQLQVEFRKDGRFASVGALDSYDSEDAAKTDRNAAFDDFRQADRLDLPIRSAEDMALLDQQRNAATLSDDTPLVRTLVIRVQVIDYAKGNKLLQLSMMDLGNAILTIRLSYFDKSTGEELGRSVVSSDTSTKVIPSAISSRSVLGGVVEGLMDQVIRRKVEGER